MANGVCVCVCVCVSGRRSTPKPSRTWWSVWYRLSSGDRTTDDTRMFEASVCGVITSGRILRKWISCCPLARGDVLSSLRSSTAPTPEAPSARVVMACSILILHTTLVST